MVICFVAALLAAAVDVVPAVRSARITDAKLPPEGYRIRIDAEGKAKVEFADDAGWFYANKTLDQLPKDVTNIEIEDWPAYRWRGVMLDEGRHFFGKTAVKDILARMSALKMNVFHWHLTEDQGWRLDIPGMPELVKYGAVRPCSWRTYTENESDGKPYGPFFYTPDDVREIVKYAKGMHIRVIPEIELPGHARALLAAHPEFSCAGKDLKPRTPWTATGITDEVLCAGNDEAIAFMERVFDRIVEMFPDEVVHIGGDECPKKYWKTCPKCQARMKKLGLKDESGLQAWLTHHFVDYLKSKGRRAIGWDEILEGGLGEGAMVQSWRMAGWQGADGKVEKSPVVRAAEEGHDVVASSLPYTYFSLPASTNETIVYRRPAAKYGPTELLPVEKAYAFDPTEGVPDALKGRIVGSESCNWTEGTRDYENLKAKMWPRTAALAEVLWTGADRPGVEDFLHRMTGAEVVVCDTKEGPVKPMHAVNNGPKKKGTDQIRGNFDAYKAARIPFARTHDANFAAAYGGPHTVDITAIFPNFEADENDPANYDFACTDDYLATMRAAGTEPFYRLGQTIEHTVKKYGSKPPRDFAKWARICEHVIAHYTEGWAKGYTWDIRYWEIWNEPDNQNPADVSRSSCWGGTAEQFHEFFKTAATHLKGRFPNLKIGGPAVCWDRAWATKFLDCMKKENVPLDFFSWHIYTTDVAAVADRCRFYRRLLDERGYAETESICNEWNYVRDFRANWVYSLRVESGDLNHKGAAYIAAVLCAAQQAPVDMMMYYDARIGTQMNGMFDFVTLRPLRGYYPFYAWSKLAELGRAVRVSVKDAPDVWAAAAIRGAHGAVLVARYTDDNDEVTPRRVRVRLPEGTPAKVLCHVTDDSRMFTEQPVDSAEDGVVSLDLEPAAFALIEW